MNSMKLKGYIFGEMFTLQQQYVYRKKEQIDVIAKNWNLRARQDNLYNKMPYH